MTGFPTLDRHIAPEPMSGCWLWVGCRDKQGYGKVGGRAMGTTLAHKATFELVYDCTVPTGWELDHLCRVRACVNPKHLEVVTHQENTRRGDVGKWQRDKTVCKNGHPLDAQNTHVRPNGRRRCNACGRMWSANARQARRLQGV